MADIARALERKNKSGVYRVLALNGGIALLARRRAQRALRLAEREEISRGIAAGWSMRTTPLFDGACALKAIPRGPPADARTEGSSV